MPDFTPKTFRIAGCQETETRQSFEPIKRLIDAMVAGDVIQANVQNSVYSQIWAQGELGEDLPSGESALVAGKTFVGTFIRAGYMLPEGAMVGAVWNGTNYTIVVADMCEVPA